MTRDAGTMAESTKEATDEGAKVTTVAEGADATAAPPAEDKKSMLMALGAPEEVADGAIASDGDGFKDSTTPTSMFYSLKVNDDAKPEWKDHYLAYTKGAKASKGHISVSHTYNEETKEVICVESITGTDAMLNHIGNCLPHYAQMLGCGVVMKEIICVCDPTELEWWKASLSAWQAERFIVMPNHCP